MAKNKNFEGFEEEDEKLNGTNPEQDDIIEDEDDEPVTDRPRRRQSNNGNGGKKISKETATALKSVQLMLRKRNDSYSSGANFNSALADAKVAFQSILDTVKAETNVKNRDFQIIPIESSTARTLYSSIVLAARIPEKKAILYSVLMLAKTGRPELTPASILKAFPTNAEARMGKKTQEDVEREIVLPVDTFDEDFYMPYVEEQIHAKFNPTAKEAIKFVNTFVADSDVTFIRTVQDKKIPTEESTELFEAMYNALVYLVDENEEDFDFSPIADLRREQAATLISRTDVIGNNKTIRRDVESVLNIKFNQNTKENSVNAESGEQTIVRTSSYVSAVLARDIVRDPGTGKDIEQNKAQPVVVISDIAGIDKTLKYTLAGIINAISLIKPDMYPYLAMNSKSNWGELFKYQFGDVPDDALFADLKDITYKPETVINAIDEITGYKGSREDNAALAIEISNSTLSHGLSIIKAAADEDDILAKAAGKKIIEALNEMTEGNFPLTFDPLNIFANWTVIPGGYYLNAKTGEKTSLQNIDLAEFIKLGLDFESVATINEAQVSNQEFDSYLATLEALNKVGLGSAVITTKLTRAIFTFDFVNEIISAMYDGMKLKIQTDPLITRVATRAFRSAKKLGYTFKGGIGFSDTSHSFSGVSHRVPNNFRSARKFF